MRGSISETSAERYDSSVVTKKLMYWVLNTTKLINFFNKIVKGNNSVFNIVKVEFENQVIPLCKFDNFFFLK